jgi:hypothetical protein
MTIAPRACLSQLPPRFPPHLQRDIDMTDRHLRILRMVARHNQRRLTEHDVAEGAAGRAERRQRLETTATRTRARAAAAQARRRHVPVA